MDVVVSSAYSSFSLFLSFFLSYMTKEKNEIAEERLEGIKETLAKIRENL
jgi:hypothetical protein